MKYSVCATASCTSLASICRSCSTRGAQVLALQPRVVQRQAQQFTDRAQHRGDVRAGCGLVVEEQVVDAQHLVAVAQRHGQQALELLAKELALAAPRAGLQVAGPDQQVAVLAA